MKFTRISRPVHIHFHMKAYNIITFKKNYTYIYINKNIHKTNIKTLTSKEKKKEFNKIKKEVENGRIKY